MKRILLRSGKSPFDAVPTAAYLHRDVMATNVGNLLFSDSAHKLLSTPGTTVTSNGIASDPSAANAARINDEFDVFVVPLANAFRIPFHASLDRLSALVEQLTIPVVVLGVGAQAGTDGDFTALAPMEASVRRFAAAVLDRSSSIGVRGEQTADYLAGLGVRDVSVIGCPSMFLHGNDFPTPRDAGPFDAATRIALNLSPDALPVGDVAGVAAHALERHPELMYFAQGSDDAERLFWGDTSLQSGVADPFPRHLSHPLWRRGQVTVPLDVRTWLEALRTYDFAYGTRIHGNVAALLAGTPAVVLAHDSRTLELCRYFELPHRMLDTFPAETPAESLYAEADFGPMVKNHQERFARLARFLTVHGLDNAYDNGDGGVAFETRLAAVDLPPSVRLWDGSDDGDLRYRISRLRERQQGLSSTQASLGTAQATLRSQLTAARAKNTELAERLSALEKRLAATERKQRSLERTLERNLLRRVRRLLRRVRRRVVATVRRDRGTAALP